MLCLKVELIHLSNSDLWKGIHTFIVVLVILLVVLLLSLLLNLLAGILLTTVPLVNDCCDNITAVFNDA